MLTSFNQSLAINKACRICYQLAGNFLLHHMGFLFLIELNS